MRDRRVVELLIILALVAACRSRERANTDASRQTPLTVPEDTSPDTAGCQIVTQVLHPNPAPLIAEYLRRDSAGEFTSSDSWSPSATICPGRMAGFDTYAIISGYDLLLLQSRADTVQYQVTYHVYAQAVDDSLHELNLVRQPEVDTFAVVRTPYGWRINPPDLPPHISPAATLRIMQVKSRDRAALVRVAHER